jgi:hypothetical protein
MAVPGREGDLAEARPLWDAFGNGPSGSSSKGTDAVVAVRAPMLAYPPPPGEGSYGVALSEATVQESQTLPSFAWQVDLV